jgi:hypothetical protein
LGLPEKSGKNRQIPFNLSLFLTFSKNDLHKRAKKIESLKVFLSPISNWSMSPFFGRNYFLFPLLPLSGKFALKWTHAPNLIGMELFFFTGVRPICPFFGRKGLTGKREKIDEIEETKK